MNVLTFPAKLDACGGNTTVEHEQVEWQLVERGRELVLRALPRGAAAPLTYRWTVFGTDVAGSGSTTVAGVEVIFDEHSPILRMNAPEGTDVAGSIVIVATDADGRTLRAIRHVNSPSRTRLGGCCPEHKTKLTLRDAADLLAQARVAQRVFDAGVRRLQHIAEAGVLNEVESMSITEAVKRLR